jgi:PAS domain S-box-containing protein
MSGVRRDDRSGVREPAAWFGRLPFVVSGLYAAFGAVWIVYSDRLLLGVTGSLDRYQLLQTYKGTVFVIASALLVYVLLVYAAQRVRAVCVTLAENEDRLRLAIRCARGSVWEMAIDGSGRDFSYVTPDLLARLGLSPDRPPRRDEWDARLHPDDRARARAAFHDVLAAGGGEFETLTRFNAADGATLWLETRASLMPARDGEPARLIGVSLDVTRRVEAEEELNRALRYDAATGLAKPQKFADDLEAVLADAAPGSVVGVFHLRPRGLDSVATVTGDNAAALEALAERLKPLRTGGCLVARVATDVFAVATPPLTGLRAVHDRLDAVLARLGDDDAPGDIGTAFAVGAAVFPDDGQSAPALSRASAHALDALGPGLDTRVLWFTEGLDDQYRRHADMVRALRRAVDNGEIVCHFQPLISLESGRAVGFEALVRWRRDGALVPPGRFVALAEQTGDIRAIGEEVLRQACAAAAGWRAPDGAEPFVAVNVSPVQLADPRFPAQVARALNASGLDPQRLELEVTESVLAVDLDAAARRLASLRALGVAVAVDDFGTGYSSLALLSRLPFTRLKIDRCFVAEENGNTAILETIVALARRLGLATTAEGIETETQMLRVAGIGIDVGQGFHFAEPVPREAAAEMVAASWRVTPGARSVVA